MIKSIPAEAKARGAFPVRYEPQPFLSTLEAQLFASLQQLSSGRCRIACKPMLGDFLKHHDRTGSFQKVGMQHVDFLVCRNEDWLPMVGVDILGTKESEGAEREWSLFISNVFSSAGIPLVQTNASEIHKLQPLAEKLSRAWWERWEHLAAQTILEERRPALRWK